MLNNKTLAQLVETTKSARVLDIGSYTGDHIIERVKKIKNPDIYGLEIENDYIQISRKKGVKAVQGDVEKRFPFKANFFDMVSANQIIEHLLNIDDFMTQIHRVLKPGGYLLLSTENLSSWHNIFALCLGWQAFSQHMSLKKNIGNPFRLPVKDEGYRTSGVHVKIFTLKGLIQLMELYDFKVETIFGAGYYPCPPPLSTFLAKIDPYHSPFIGLKARKVAR